MEDIISTSVSFYAFFPLAGFPLDSPRSPETWLPGLSPLPAREGLQVLPESPRAPHWALGDGGGTQVLALSLLLEADALGKCGVLSTES